MLDSCAEWIDGPIIYLAGDPAQIFKAEKKHKMSQRHFIIALLIIKFIGCPNILFASELYNGEVVIDNSHADKYVGSGMLDNGTRIGKWIFWDDKKVVYQIRNYDSHGVLNGDFLEFYQSGNLAVMGHYNNGKASGIWIGFHDNRSIRYIRDTNHTINERGVPFTEWYDEQGVPKSGSNNLLLRDVTDGSVPFDKQK